MSDYRERGKKRKVIISSLPPEPDLLNVPFKLLITTVSLKDDSFVTALVCAVKSEALAHE